MIPHRKIGLLGALYFAQGLPFGFQATALPIYLRQAGLSLTAIGFLGVLALPWMLKALWSPWVDRYHGRLGRRKSWIVPMQLGLIVTAALASFVPAQQWPVLLILIFLMNLFAATQDIAVDGWAVDLLTPEELGLGNAAQVVGYKIGMLTGGGLLVWASDHIGWSGLFMAMAGLATLVLIIVLWTREDESFPSIEAEGLISIRHIVQAVGQTLRSKGAGWLLLAVATYKFGESMADAMFKPFLVDQGLTASTIGQLVGTYGLIFSLLGSALGGWLASRRSILHALLATATLRIIPLIGQWYLTTTSITDTHVAFVTSAEHFFGGMLTTCMFAFMMSKVDRRIGATHFTVLASVEVLGKLPAAGLSGLGAQHFGYAGVFLAAVVLSVAYLAALVPFFVSDK